MRACDIRAHFLDQVDWVDPEHTNDRILAGDPNKEVKSVVVTWMAGYDAIRYAIDRGADLLVTHEPAFWDFGPDCFADDPFGLCDEKKKFIDDGGLTILRNHDVWDRMPEVGIPWSWARFLELGNTPAARSSSNFLHRYDIEPTTLEEFARHVAARTATIGEPLVQVIGDPNQTVSKIGIGTGCGCEIRQYMHLGCDLSVVCDDGSSYWSYIQYAKDRKHPVVRVNHCTSEEPGMVALTQYFNEHFDGVTAEHLPHGCSFRLVGAE